MPSFEEIQKVIIDHALHRISDEELANNVLPKLDDFEAELKEQDVYDLFRRLKNSSYGDTKEAASKIHTLFSPLLDISLLEQERLNQIQFDNEEYVPIKEMSYPQEWLSGGISFEYIGTDEKEHQVLLNYPFDLLIKNSNDLVGALYIDQRLVPIRSILEKSLINDLKLGSRHSAQKIVNFVSSEQYLKIAKELGRIKNGA